MTIYYGTKRLRYGREYGGTATVRWLSAWHQHAGMAHQCQEALDDRAVDDTTVVELVKILLKKASSAIRYLLYHLLSSPREFAAISIPRVLPDFVDGGLEGINVHGFGPFTAVHAGGLRFM